MNIKKPLFFSLFVLLLCTGCRYNYFSKYHTVYRISGKDGTHYYSESEPKRRDGTYYFKDLDDNKTTVSEDAVAEIKKFKHKK